MESLLKSVTLTQDVVRVLDEIRAGAENALYGAKSGKSEELFSKHIVSLVEGAGLPVLQTMHYRWFLRELARLWRTRTGRDLAFHLELCIRKWVGLGLEPKTLQFLVCEAHERLKGKDLTTKTQRHEEDETTAKDAKTAKGGADSAAVTEQSAESADVQARISHPPITPITEDSSSVRNPNLPESVESVDDTPDSTPTPGPSPLAPNLDLSLPGIMSGPRPPITPITEDSSESARSSNLRKSVESVDARSPRTAKDAKTAKGGDMTGLSDNTDRVPSPEPELTTKTPRHEGPEQSAKSVESVDELGGL